MLNINNGFHWCIVNFCMKQSWLNEMGPRAGRAQQQRALSHRWLAVSHSLFSPCCTWNSPGRYSPVSARRRSPGESPGCSRRGSRGLLTASCWRCVWQRDWGATGPVRARWVSSIFCPEWEEGCEERRERAGIQKEAAGICVCSLWWWIWLFICQTPGSRGSPNTQPVVLLPGFEILKPFKLARNTNKTPHDTRGPGWAQWWAVCTSASASAVDRSESSRPDNGRLAPLCCCQPGEQSHLEWLQRSGERLARSAHVSVSEALSCRRALLWSTCTNRRCVSQ